MTTPIIHIDYRQLTREEQVSLNETILDIVKKSCGACGKPFNVFFEASKIYKTMLSKKLQIGSQSLSTLDQSADHSWSAFNAQLKASLMHPYADIVEAANKIAVVFNNIKNPTKLNYEREYGALSVLIESLNDIDRSVFEKAMLLPHYDALRDAVIKFIDTQKEMLELKNEQRAYDLDLAEKDCSKAWSDLATYLEVKDNADELPGAADAILLLNTLFAKIEARMKARETLRKKKQEGEQTAEAPETESNIIEEALNDTVNA